MMKILYFLLLVFISTFNCYSQVGMNTIDPNPSSTLEVYSENINRRVKGIRPSDEDDEPDVPARPVPVEKPRPKLSTEAYPPSILHAIASNIESQRKKQSESHIHPDDPGTDLEDVKESKEKKKLSNEEAEAYKARIDAILKRKKELHDLLGVK